MMLFQAFAIFSHILYDQPLFPILSIKCFFPISIFLKILFIYLWETQKEAETQADGEAGSMQGAWCGTPSQDCKITPWAEGDI